jgi:hypothetical protein
MGGRRRLGRPAVGCRFKRVGSRLRQIRDGNVEARRRVPTGTKRLMPCFQEKPLSFRHYATVPQTDTGGLGENPKALERTLVKELGKIVP